MKKRKKFKSVSKKEGCILDVWDSLEFIKKYKIPVVKSKLVKKSEDAVAFANSIGYPVALKISSSSVIHKTDVNGVALNLRSKEELEKSYKKMAASFKRRAEGFVVQKMVEGGQQVIVGGKTDEQFGQVIMFGLGGIFTEVFDDVSFRVVPISKEDAEEMVSEIKGYKVLKGYRGKSYDIKSLVDILLKVSKMLEENKKIKELDINPVFSLKKGALAVDARIISDG